tara:strand:- start:1870 stop:2523 length:654 start_codon:yes stop_codon:yes gene_type:complete
LKGKSISVVIRRLRKITKSLNTPVVEQIAKSQEPFRVLISCLLSLRTRDEVTYYASERLLNLANMPMTLLKLRPSTIEKAIYPVAFYRIKTKTILHVCQELTEKYNHKVPDSLDELLKLKGVGRKTANLTLTLGYGKLGICVDTHVHRITNRWGYLNTKRPEETEMILRAKLPKRYWNEINGLLVTFGQNICKPISPYCSECCVGEFCSKVGVRRNR